MTVEVVDESEQKVPYAEIPIRFLINGDGELAGVGNGNPSDMRSFQSPECTTFRGRCLVILRPKGKAGSIYLKAMAEGLESASLSIRTL